MPCEKRGVLLCVCVMRDLALSKIDTTWRYRLPPELLAATLLRRVEQPDEDTHNPSTENMELQHARHDAQQLLMKLIEHQPHLLQTPPPVTGVSGEAAALFCERFIEVYAACLVKKTQ